MQVHFEHVPSCCSLRCISCKWWRVCRAWLALSVAALWPGGCGCWVYCQCCFLVVLAWLGDASTLCCYPGPWRLGHTGMFSVRQGSIRSNSCDICSFGAQRQGGNVRTNFVGLRVVSPFSVGVNRGSLLQVSFAWADLPCFLSGWPIRLCALCEHHWHSFHCYSTGYSPEKLQPQGHTFKVKKPVPRNPGAEALLGPALSGTEKRLAELVSLCKASQTAHSSRSCSLSTGLQR